MLSNFDGVRNLLDFAKENGNCRVLYISSSEVYPRRFLSEAVSLPEISYTTEIPENLPARPKKYRWGRWESGES